MALQTEELMGMYPEETDRRDMEIVKLVRKKHSQISDRAVVDQANVCVTLVKSRREHSNEPGKYEEARVQFCLGD